MSLPPAAIRELRRICGDDAVFDDRVHRRVYDADAYPLDRAAPDVVVLPRRKEHVADLLRWCLRQGVPYAPRGAGTGLSGGCLTVGGGVQIGLSRLRRILNVDRVDRVVQVEAGVVNLELNELLAPHGLCFAPDPSSQAACTLGGNFAENAGGPHTLKYGVTLPHVLAVELVAPDGELLRIGGRTSAGPGLDMLALQTGAEGTLGIAVELSLRLSPIPESVKTFLAVCDHASVAAELIRHLVASGVIPAAMEMIDKVMLQAVEEAFHFGFPRGAGAVLIVEVDGSAENVREESDKVREACETLGVNELREARDASERARLWKARKHAFGAVGRLAPDYATQDGVVPRASVPRIVEHIGEVARRNGLTIGTVIHAGDGNIHPIILYDQRDPLQVRQALSACSEILDECIHLGGSPTGEHGVGLQKREFLPLLFGEDDLEAMHALRRAFDPSGLSNPQKILPGGGGCGELRAAPLQRASAVP